MLSAQDKFAAGHLLGFAKSGVRNGAIAITETSTGAVRDVLRKHLNQDIDQHAQIFEYMLAQGLYPSYDLDKIIEGDLRNAQVALQLPVS
ncbi:hypothetical protein J31TS4_22060 [Paenibacillus sp. J31TS4]|uniref:spore coat protein n=1 Tax=Paenibacillus sp. J31TS4 TaxID=2807195 RepID=UPI001B1A500A|nr:spore coat protein [Paenibacillus sp. J31TS4]GIP38926.1 hypothetical protein J31TS4_22060 [Paenibacillus sp. J31TS4]